MMNLLYFWQSFLEISFSMLLSNFKELESCFFIEQLLVLWGRLHAFIVFEAAVALLLHVLEGLPRYAHHGIALQLLIVLAVQCHQLSKMWQEVSPHDVVLVDVGALDLGHLSEMITHEPTIVVGHSARLLPALICVEA
jgi:hypothetical protein